jgi:hypothetical protein
VNSYAFLSGTAATALFKLVALTIILTLGTVTMAPSAWSQDAAPASTGDGSEGGSASSAGMQAAAGLSTLIYLPLKAAFAICGGIVGGLTYAFTAGNENAAKSVWTTSMYGTYIITPDHLRGDKPIRFLGVPDQEAPAQATAPAMEPVPAPGMEPVR